MWKCFRLSALFLMIFIPLNLTYAGETGKISGFIKDKETNEPLLGANVIVETAWFDNKEVPLEIPTGASTDEDGTFFIINLRPGLYNVRIVYLGYREELRTKVKVDVDKTTRLDFELLPEALETEEVVVIAYQPTKVEKDLTATKQVYDIRDIQSIAGVEDVSDILDLQADVVDDHFRGGRVGESAYYLGGGTINNPLDNERAFSPIVTGLEQVEVYTSGFSAEYGNAQSGVVNMVTKEGSDRWRTRLEFNGTIPYYKTFRGSVYDPENLYFFNDLINTEEWLEENPTQPGRPLYDPGYGFGPIYLPPRNVWPPDPLTHEDSLKIAQLGQILWLQSVRDVGLDYEKRVDYRIDFTTGGPISKNFKIFIAARQNQNQAIVPTTQPDLNRQLMGNLVWQPNIREKFKLTAVFDNQYENVVGSNWLRYMFDRTFGLSQLRRRTLQFGLDWNHVFNPSSFLDVRFKLLDVLTEERIELLQKNEFIEDYSSGSNWVDYTGPSNHRVGRPEDDRGDERTKTYDFVTSFTSQINRHNLLKAGGQFTYYSLTVNQQENVASPGNFRIVEFDNNPFEGAFYIQDKMEFEGLIANLGLRFDFYDLNTIYYTDRFSPLRNPNFDPSDYFGPKKYDPNLAETAKTKLYTRLQPRIGVSFPISESSVFHLNYGSFTQRPNFNQLFYNRIDPIAQESGVPYIDIIGNPRLKPETTNAYDIGLVKGFSYGLRLDVSAYYKDVKDLVQLAYFKDADQNVYSTYINRDYADITGFHVSFERITGFIQGYVRYNYQVAKGKTSNDQDVPTTFDELATANSGFVDGPDPEDVFLDYDRTHKAVINLRFHTSPTAGPSIGKFRPLADFRFSTTFRYLTGRPYTFDESGLGLKYNQRTPIERELKFRIEKGISIAKSVMTLYFEGFNLLNEEYYQYSRTFDNPYNTAKWHNDKDNVLVYDLYAPYITRQDIYLLRNDPRHYRLGIIFRF